VLFYNRRELEAVYIWQSHVQENDSRRFLLEFGQGLAATLDQDWVPSRSEHLAQIMKISDNQYLPCHQQLSFEPGVTKPFEKN